ncbi:NAC domain-containing protein 2 isoform X2 [Cajanus cajan]|uniref:NAC domain-containing protein 29 n=1 Tax=Cajanus cajan TaxID=3821 RepID=A0A151RSB4_CAJCA|nr:NAC domain-containing protein 2 isoform X2 [Cajanus cajan]KYP45399.1 NAC domain-containing protein 29 [Cajanus cajan]
MEGRTTTSVLPPGFRFHPTDEELIVYYLCNQATSRPCPASIIPEVDIYKFDPWELPDKSDFGENEWYFFSPRERKYPNGVRPNRATVSGYWKATGTDKAIYSGSKHIGVKKALVFYKGKPPKGIKTDWIMHEYRLIGSRRQANRQIGSMRLDDWVLCRIYKKKNMGKSLEAREDYPISQINIAPANNDSDQHEVMKFPRTSSLTHLLEMDYLGPISHILSDGSFNSTFDFQINTDNGGIDPFVKPQLVEMPNNDPYASDSGKYQVKQNSTLNPTIFVNQVYDQRG